MKEVKNRLRMYKKCNNHYEVKLSRDEKIFRVNFLSSLHCCSHVYGCVPEERSCKVQNNITQIVGKLLGSQLDMYIILLVYF